MAYKHKRDRSGAPQAGHRSVAIAVMVGALALTVSFGCEKRNARGADTIPTGPQTLRWDFQKKDELTYTMTQNTRSFSPKGTITANAEARLVVESRGGGEASATLQATSVSGTGVKAASAEELARASVKARVMREDSTFSDADAQAEAQLKLLFLLPREPLKVGAKASQEVRYPMQVQQEMTWIKGRAEQTLEKIEPCGEDYCAFLRTDWKLETIDGKPELAEQMDMKLKGSSEAVFALGARRFASGKVTFDLILELKVGPPELRQQGQHHEVSFSYADPKSPDKGS